MTFVSVQHVYFADLTFSAPPPSSPTLEWYSHFTSTVTCRLTRSGSRGSPGSDAVVTSQGWRTAVSLRPVRLSSGEPECRQATATGGGEPCVRAARHVSCRRCPSSSTHVVLVAKLHSSSVPRLNATEGASAGRKHGNGFLIN